MNGLGRLIDKEKRNLYDDDLVLYSVRIGQNYKDNEVINTIRKVITDFITRVKDETITLREINQTIVVNKKNLKEIILIFDP